MFRKSGRAPVRRQSQQTQRPSPPVLKSPREIQIMREAGRIVARVHLALKEAIQPGVSTWDLDRLAVEVMQKYDAASALSRITGAFPAHICTSINEELVHGIPKQKANFEDGRYYKC